MTLFEGASASEETSLFASDDIEEYEQARLLTQPFISEESTVTTTLPSSSLLVMQYAS